MRHGITDACLKDTKNKDVYMSNNGVEQIKKSLCHIPLSVKTIYTSPTLRTIQTANIVSQTIPTCKIIVDSRIKNKLDSEFSDYFQNLKSFLDGLTGREEDMLIVSHGRILKMIYSIINFDKIDISVINTLDIDYGDLFCIHQAVEGRLVFLEWQKINIP